MTVAVEIYEPQYTVSVNETINEVTVNQTTTTVEILDATTAILPVGPLQLAQLTTTQINAIVSPADGTVVYNTTIDHVCAYSNGIWVKFNHSHM